MILVKSKASKLSRFFTKMDRIRNFKLPSRNTSIFLGTVGTIIGSIMYDKYQVKAVQADLKKRAALIGDKPAQWNSKTRKVMVYLDSTSWSRYWFANFVKPVFDAGALDYILVDKDHTAEIIESTRDIVWDAKEMYAEEHHVPVKQAGWFWSSITPEEQEREARKAEQLAIKTYAPHLYKPKYDHEIGIVSIGPIAWRHVLFGLQMGSLTAPTKPRLFEQNTVLSVDEMIHPSMELPTLGFITGKNLSGFAQFPFRFIGWFTKRKMAEQIGEDALKIVQAEQRKLSADDFLLGSEDYRPSPTKKEKEASEMDLINEQWNRDAENADINSIVVDKLSIYK